MNDSRFTIICSPLCHVERRAAGPKLRHLDSAEYSPLRSARVHARPTVEIPRLRLRLRSERQESVALSGAIAESKGLEFAKHSPLRFARIYANPPSRPLGFARGDSLCCHVERSTFRCEVETSRLIGAFTLTNLPRSAQPAKDERLSAVLRPGWLRTAGAKRRFDRLSC